MQARSEEDEYTSVPYSLSEGSRRPIQWSGLQGEGKEIGRVAYSVLYKKNTVSCN